MSRREQIEETFVKNFVTYKNKNIVIYGTGQYARWIGSNFTEFNVIGFLDRSLSYGELCGKPILSYKEVKEAKVDLIIIAANTSNTEKIYKRIGGFCKDNSIKLFTLEGELLDTQCLEQEQIRGLKGDYSDSYETVVDNLRFLDCQKAVKEKNDVIYWNLIKDRFFINGEKIDALGKLHVEQAYDVGYLFLGPLVTDFMLWLVGLIEEKKCDKILFVARDGYILQKLYEYLKRKEEFKKLPDSLYLFTSRIVCMLSALQSEEDVCACARIIFEGKAEQMLKTRFQLNEDEILLKIKPESMGLEDYILLHKEPILKKAEKIRNNYVQYLKANHLDKDDNILFFDLAASGTCQKMIEKLLNKKITGAYMLRLLTDDVEKKNLNIIPYHEFEDNFALHSMFMECILTSLQPTVLYIDEKLQPVFAEETRSAEELRFTDEAQQGIFDYFKAAIDNLERKEKYKTSVLPSLIFEHITSYYTVIDNTTFDNYILKDEILNQQNSISNRCMV